MVVWYRDLKSRIGDVLSFCNTHKQFVNYVQGNLSQVQCDRANLHVDCRFSTELIAEFQREVGLVIIMNKYEMLHRK
jgi:hypothetical protein